MPHGGYHRDRQKQTSTRPAGRRSAAGGKGLAVATTLGETAWLDDVASHARLAETLAHIPIYEIISVTEPMPWNDGS